MKRVDQSSRSIPTGWFGEKNPQGEELADQLCHSYRLGANWICAGLSREGERLGSNQSLLPELISPALVLLLGDLAPNSLSQQVPPATFLRLVRSTGVVSLPSPETLHRTELPLAGVRLEGFVALRACLIHSSLPSDSKKARYVRGFRSEKPGHEEKNSARMSRGVD
jgi:hypothetical protein